MDRTICTIDEDGRLCFHIGKTRIRVTEHFAERGGTMVELIEELVLYAARQENRDSGRGS